MIAALALSVRAYSAAHALFTTALLLLVCLMAAGAFVAVCEHVWKNTSFTHKRPASSDAAPRRRRS